MVRDLDANRERLVVAADWAGTHCLDPCASGVEVTIPTGDAAVAVDLDDRLLVIAQATEGVAVYDLRKAEPVLLWRWRSGSEIVDVELDGDTIWAVSSLGRLWRLEAGGVRGSWTVGGEDVPPRFADTEIGAVLLHGRRVRSLRSGDEVSLSHLVGAGAGRWFAGGPLGLVRWGRNASDSQQVFPRPGSPAWDVDVAGDRIALAAGATGVALFRTDERGDAAWIGALRPDGIDQPNDVARGAPESAPWEPTLVQVSALPLEGEPKAVVVDDERAFVAAGEGGLRVVDVSHPHHPEEIGSYDPPNTPTYAHDLVLHRDHLIAAVGGPDDEKIFRIFDVADGPDPLLVADGGSSPAIVVGLDTGEDRLYLSGMGGGWTVYGFISIYDLREIEEPRQIGGLSGTSSGTYWAAITVDPAAEGEIFYCYNAPWRLWTFDATYPADVEYLGWGWWGAGASEMVIAGDILHQAPGGGAGPGYRAIRPDREGWYELEAELDLGGRRMNRLHVHGDRLYGIGDDRLWILDISDTSAPELLLPPQIVVGITDVFVDSAGFIYVTIAGEGLRIYRLFRPR